jgi:hypothetical protein
MLPGIALAWGLLRLGDRLVGYLSRPSSSMHSARRDFIVTVRDIERLVTLSTPSDAGAAVPCLAAYRCSSVRLPASVRAAGVHIRGTGIGAGAVHGEASASTSGTTAAAAHVTTPVGGGSGTGGAGSGGGGGSSGGGGGGGGALPPRMGDAATAPSVSPSTTSAPSVPVVGGLAIPVPVGLPVPVASPSTAPAPSAASASTSTSAPTATSTVAGDAAIVKVAAMSTGTSGGARDRATVIGRGR